MMEINFPDTPSVNDTFTVSGSVYVWSGISWNAVNTVTDVQSLINESVSDLVDSAPETLNTLNELAAALGDDANFATTVTSSIATKQDKVEGVSDTEIGYLDGVTSAIQTQINTKQATLTGAATTIASDNLTASRALASDGSGKVAASSATSAELAHLSGVTSAIQTQIDSRISRTNGTVTAASTSSTVVRNITLSTADPSGGIDGDVWLKYTPYYARKC